MLATWRHLDGNISGLSDRDRIGITAPAKLLLIANVLYADASRLSSNSLSTPGPALAVR